MQEKHVKNCLNVKVRTMLVNNLILSKLDYGNAVLAACNLSDINALQVVMNNAVRFILDVGKRAHITPYLKKLHFLPVKQQILYKLCLISYKIMNNAASFYLTNLFHFINQQLQCHYDTQRKAKEKVIESHT